MGCSARQAIPTPKTPARDAPGLGSMSLGLVIGSRSASGEEGRDEVKEVLAIGRPAGVEVGVAGEEGGEEVEEILGVDDAVMVAVGSTLVGVQSGTEVQAAPTMSAVKPAALASAVVEPMPSLRE